MTEKEFCFWLKSAFELCGAKEFNEQQTKLIKEHLDLVFTKVTPTPGLAAVAGPVPVWPNITLDPNYTNPNPIKFDLVCSTIPDLSHQKYCSTNDYPQLASVSC